MQLKRSIRRLAALAAAPVLCAGCGGSHHPIRVRWLASRISEDGKTVRLVYAESSSRPPVGVLVRSTSGRVGLTLEISNPPAALSDLHLWCAEIVLDEPVAGRRLLDDTPGKFNPYRVSIPAAQRAVDNPRFACAPVRVIHS
jgi:hypothetical protein